MNKVIWRSLSSVSLLMKQHLHQRFKGSVLGILWLFLQPIVYVVLFTLVFAKFMSVRMDIDGQTHSYVIYLISGLLLWNAFINCFLSMSNIYQQYSSYLKKIPLSLFIFPLFVPVLEFIIWLVGMLVFVFYLALSGYEFSYAFLGLLPLVVAVLALAYGLGMIAAVLNTFISDITHMLNMLSQVFFWATPIVYVRSMLPDLFQDLLWLNPMSYPVHLAQLIVLEQKTLDYHFIFWCLVICLIIVVAQLFLKQSEKVLRDLI